MEIQKLTRRSTLAAAAAAAFLIVVVAWSGQASSAASATFSVTPAQQTVDLSAGTVTVEVQIANASGMGSFDFVLRYDPGVLSDPNPQPGAFLSSAPATPQCIPLVDGPAGVGTLDYGCAFGGQTGSSGMSGSGVIATITFHLAGGSNTSLSIEHARIGDANGQYICGGPSSDQSCPTTGGSLTVSGGNSGSNQGVSATPTLVRPAPGGNSDGSTPTAVPAGGSTGGATPISDGTGLSSGDAGARTGGSTTGGRATGTGRSASGAQGTSAGGKAPQPGKFGTGPAAQSSMATYARLLGLVFVSFGALFIFAGRLIKDHSRGGR